MENTAIHEGSIVDQLLRKLEDAGFRHEEIQTIIDSRDNRLAKKLRKTLQNDARGPQTDWGASALIVLDCWSTVSPLVNSFLDSNPDWSAKIDVENGPPKIRLSFWLKPEAAPRRKTKADPHRAMNLNDDEVNGIASFVTELVEATFLNAKRGGLWDISISGRFLEYELRPNYTAHLK